MYEVQYIDQNMSFAQETKIGQFYKIIKFRGINMWEKQWNHVKTALNTLHFATHLIFNLHISIFLCRDLTTRKQISFRARKFTIKSKIAFQLLHCGSATPYMLRHTFLLSNYHGIHILCHIQAVEIYKKQQQFVLINKCKWLKLEEREREREQLKK